MDNVDMEWPLDSSVDLFEEHEEEPFSLSSIRRRSVTYHYQYQDQGQQEGEACSPQKESKLENSSEQDSVQSNPKSIISNDLDLNEDLEMDDKFYGNRSRSTETETTGPSTCTSTSTKPIRSRSISNSYTIKSPLFRFYDDGIKKKLQENKNDCIIVSDDGQSEEDDLDLDLVDPMEKETSQNKICQSVDGNGRTQENNSREVFRNLQTPPLSASDDLTSSQGCSTFFCPFCEFQESSLQCLENHIAMIHPEISAHSPKKSNDISASDPTSTETCTDASRNDSTEINSYTCPFCDLNLGDAVSLFSHVQERHAENMMNSKQNFSCPLCNFSSDFEHEIIHHVTIHETDGTYYGISPCDSERIKPDSLMMTCPLCGLLMTDLDLLNSHVEGHFNEQHSSGSSSYSTTSHSVAQNQRHPAEHDKENKRNGRGPSSTVNDAMETDDLTNSPSNERGSYRKQHERGLERAFMRGEISTATYHEERAKLSRLVTKDVDDGQTRVTGITEKICELFRRQGRSDQRVYMCAPTDHYSSSYGDKGWGCGYRNFQMMYSCLIRNSGYADKLCAGGQTTIPSIPRVQELIEKAWRLGFDPQGCQQLGGSVVKTRKWIGATEIVATFSSLRIKCHLVDFHFPSSPDGTHPRLVQWVSDYFCSGTGFKPPLYLQHQGHSRTIIGVEKEKCVTKLLLFDPGNTSIADIARAPLSWKQMRTFRRPQVAFQARQYQIVAVVGTLSDTEYQESKILKSERVA